jgi:hypothetical protein
VKEYTTTMVLGDRWELVRLDMGKEESYYSSVEQNKVERMRDYWKRQRPYARFRIDHLVRSKGETV